MLVDIDVAKPSGTRSLTEIGLEPSVVVHAKSGRRIGYGEIVAFAEIPAVAPAIKPEY